MFSLAGLLASLVLLSSFTKAEQETVSKRDTAAVLRQQFGDFKEECFPRPSGGCNCNVKDSSGVETVKKFDSDADCRVPIEVETAANKQKVNEQIEHKFGAFKENCFPKPSGGCKCNEKDMHGNEIVASYDAEVDCKLRTAADVQDLAKTMQNKQKVNEEIKQKFGNFKENCFPKPSGGCKCNEKDASGNEVVATYSADVDCKIPARTKRATTQRPSQNVRDPVRERAQANYAAVVNELNEKFKGLKEGCFPRPKGCLCVIGKDRDGRDITERRMKDADCKCQPGERGKGCPAGGA